MPCVNKELYKILHIPGFMARYMLTFVTAVQIFNLLHATNTKRLFKETKRSYIANRESGYYKIYNRLWNEQQQGVNKCMIRASKEMSCVDFMFCSCTCLLLHNVLADISSISIFFLSFSLSLSLYIYIYIYKLKIKSVTYSSQGSHTVQLDFCN